MHLLRDSVQLEAGNWQELLDLKFHFIEGAPARDVLGVEAFWKGQYGLSFDQNIVAYEYTPDAAERVAVEDPRFGTRLRQRKQLRGVLLQHPGQGQRTGALVLGGRAGVRGQHIPKGTWI